MSLDDKTFASLTETRVSAPQAIADALAKRRRRATLTQDGMRPEQIIHSLPHAVAVMLSPADCGPAVLALPQDVQAEAFDFPDEFFETTVHHVPRQRADLGQLQRAVASLKDAARPLIIAGGGVRYSQAAEALAAFAEAHNVPVVETVAGRA